MPESYKQRPVHPVVVVNPESGEPLEGGAVTIGGVTFVVDGRVLHGLATDRPTAALAHAALPFAYYNAVDTQAVSQTDGTNWVDL